MSKKTQQTIKRLQVAMSRVNSQHETIKHYKYAKVGVVLEFKLDIESQIDLTCFRECLIEAIRELDKDIEKNKHSL